MRWEVSSNIYSATGSRNSHSALVFGGHGGGVRRRSAAFGVGGGAKHGVNTERHDNIKAAACCISLDTDEQDKTGFAVGVFRKNFKDRTAFKDRGQPPGSQKNGLDTENDALSGGAQVL